MSDAATPATAPAGDAMSIADHVTSLLMREDEAAETAAQPDAEQTSAGEEAPDPDAGETQSQEPEPDPEPEEPPKYRVKVRGAEVEVPLPELLNGYSRTEDYKAKTAEVAEQRRAAEAAKAEFTARAQQLDTLLQQANFDPVLEQGNKTNWLQLAQDDPAGYVQQRAAYDARLGFWNNVAAQRQQAAEIARQQQLERADVALSEALPEWREPTKRTEVVRQVKAALSQYGFNDQEMAGLADHRMLLIALDAARYRAGQTARATAETKKVAPKPAVVMKPGTPQAKGASDTARALADRAMRSGRTEDQVNAIMAALGEN